jgi:serine protease Do
MMEAELEKLAARLSRVTVQIRTGRESVGCGIIWSPAGLIVSNAHVARQDLVTVELADGGLLDGRVVWRDLRRDLAAVQVGATGLPIAPISEPGILRTGEIVLAFGHPFGVPQALALGIVHRVSADARGNRWIRADIRLAPGNSGGPLANAAGKIIGINTLIAGGLAHAVPVPTVQRFLSEIGARAA